MPLLYHQTLEIAVVASGGRSFECGPQSTGGDQPGAQSTLYSVVLPSKCSLSASASLRVWWTTPSR